MQGNIKKTKKRFPGSSLKSMFLGMDHQLPIDETRKADTLNILSQEIQAKELRPFQNKKNLLFTLIRFADKDLPAIHLVGCIVMLVLLFCTGNQAFNDRTNAKIMVLLSMTLPCFLVFFSVFEVRQICFIGIAELNETCFFHVRQLAALSMALSGILNLMAVSAGILLVGFQWKIRLLQIGLYVLVPFIFMQCICFGCMLTELGRRHLWLNAVFLIPLSVLCTIFVQNQTFYTESALSFWAAALLAGIIILFAETKLFFAKLGKGDILCTN